MMKSLIALFFMLTSAISVIAQKSFSIKLYQNSDFFDSEINDWDTRTTTTVHNANFNRFSVAVSLTSKKRFTHELEIFIPEFSKSLGDLQYPMDYSISKGSSIEGKAGSWSLRYELSKVLTKANKGLQFSAGAGINPYLVRIEYFSNNPQTYYSSSDLYGAAITIVPRVSYKLFPAFSLELSMPFKVYDLRVNQRRIDNPAIPIAQQETKSYNSIFFESVYTIRLGLSYTFGIHKN
ncbi:hypothetical protein WBG78_00570 [Chryseolinea sp. T2]|uniref:hypothetical protein n=1 Tax=Chryseolinea sp. T2 TaxID=3129255 RepID=UPI0030780694